MSHRFQNGCIHIILFSTCMYKIEAPSDLYFFVVHLKLRHKIIVVISLGRYHSVPHSTMLTITGYPTTVRGMQFFIIIWKRSTLIPGQRFTTYDLSASNTVELHLASAICVQGLQFISAAR